MNKLRTREQAREWLGEQGISTTQWAEDHGFNLPLVYEVLAGRKKGLRGQAHNIAIALGLKRGTPTNRPARVKREARPAQAAAQGAAL